MMVGLFEPEAAAWNLDGIPEDFSFGTLPPDWERMAPALETAMSRVPVTFDAGVRTFFCGPESFTPDRLPAVGEAPDLQGYFVAAGLNSVGILSSGGLGRVVAQWIASGRPDVDVTAIDVARFMPHQLQRDYRRDRVMEVLGKTYAAHTPGIELLTGRGTFVSPVHDEMVAAGAKLKDVSGWESADWYAGDGQSAHVTPSWGRQPWFDAVGGRAPGGARGGGPHRHVLHGDVRGDRARRRRGPRAGQCRPRRRRRRPDHLHPVARARRRHRGRPHRDQARRERLPRRGLRHGPRSHARVAATADR